MARRTETLLIIVVIAILLLGNDANLDYFLAWSGWLLRTLAKVTASEAPARCWACKTRPKGLLREGLR